MRGYRIVKIRLARARLLCEDRRSRGVPDASETAATSAGASRQLARPDGPRKVRLLYQRPPTAVDPRPQIGDFVPEYYISPLPTRRKRNTTTAADQARQGRALPSGSHGCRRDCLGSYDLLTCRKTTASVARPLITTPVLTLAARMHTVDLQVARYAARSSINRFSFQRFASPLLRHPAKANPCRRWFAQQS